MDCNNQKTTSSLPALSAKPAGSSTSWESVCGGEWWVNKRELAGGLRSVFWSIKCLAYITFCQKWEPVTFKAVKWRLFSCMLENALWLYQVRLCHFKLNHDWQACLLSVVELLWTQWYMVSGLLCHPRLRWDIEGIAHRSQSHAFSGVPERGPLSFICFLTSLVFVPRWRTVQMISAFLFFSSILASTCYIA